MASTRSTSQLSRGNHIYLYQLLKKELGCGKQTFLPRVEEALATDGLSAELMGFSNTRELLEELDNFVALTVFKGGRVYATILSQPDWDAAAKPAGKAGTGTGAKSWKRKKSGKDVKPIRPTCVKPPEPESQTVPTPMPDPDSAPQAESTPEQEPVSEGDVNTASGSDVENAPERGAEPRPEQGPETEAQSTTEPAEQADEAHDLDPNPAMAPAPEPTISLTVTYDPSGAHDPSEQNDESPKEPMPSVAECENPTQKESHTPSFPHPFSPSELDGYPLDLSRDVFCPGDVLSELTRLLPLGADVLGIANEYYYIAGEQGTLEAGRTRAAFPLRFTRNGERHEAIVHMKRRPSNHPGASWAICAVNYPAN